MSNLNIASDGQPSDDFITIPDVPIAPDSSRITPQDIVSGLRRGAQINTGADGYPQVLQGNQQTFGNGFFVAKPGNDVTQVTDASKFIFNSGQNVFKIVKTGNIDSPATNIANPGAGVYASVQAYTVINHNLGYIPAILSYINRGTSYELMPTNSASGAGSSARWFTIYPTVDINTLTIAFEVTVLNQSFTLAQGAFPIKYYLLQETAN